MMTETLADFLDRLNHEIRLAGDWGRVADYIPELAGIDPAQFGIAVALPNGRLLTAGDARTGFSIQSVSKVFSLAAVLGRIGEQLWLRVGREPSGDRFDSILLLEQEKGRPRNPFINAGALVVTDELLTGRTPRQALTELLGFIRAAAEDDAIHIDKAVARSEAETGSPQRGAGPLPPQLREPSQSARTHVLEHLFPPLRHRDELRAAGPLPGGSWRAFRTRRG